MAVGVVFVAVVGDDARVELFGELDDEEVGVRARRDLPDLLRGDERSFSSAEPARRLLGRTGLAVYERLSVG